MTSPRAMGWNRRLNPATAGVRGARACRKRRDGRRDVDDQPVPEPGASGRVRVVAGDREALRLRGEPGPGQLRGDVLPGHAEAVVDVPVAQHLAVGHVLADYGERRDRRQEVVRKWCAVCHEYLL